MDESVEQFKLTEANTKSRLRMVILYFYAGLNKYLVAGTGNKVEDFGVGFFTKYGDGGVDVSPIGDLTKTEVRQLAKYLEITDQIVTAKPTDGLWDDGRGDEDQLGATYDELEWAMAEYDKYGTNLVAGEYTERQGEIMSIYISRHNNNMHKMLPIPICKIVR